MSGKNERKTEAVKEQIRMQAIEWFSIIQSGALSPEDAASFDRWISENKEHQKVYNRISNNWLGEDHFSGSAFIKREQCKALAYKPLRRRIIDWFDENTWVAQTAVFMFVALGALFLYENRPADALLETHFRTAVGEQREVILKDGSTVFLDTASKIFVHYSEGERGVTIEGGRARFSVQRDTGRPFIVYAGGGSVTALGTEFDVRLGTDEVLVDLIEGRVAVTSQTSSPDARISSIAELKAGERVSFNNGVMSEVQDFRPEQVEAWERGMLVFSDTELGQALVEINRYSVRQFVIADAELENIRLSAVFKIGQTEEITETLVSYFPIEASLDAKKDIVLTYKVSSNAGLSPDL